MADGKINQEILAATYWLAQCELLCRPPRELPPRIGEVPVEAIEGLASLTDTSVFFISDDEPCLLNPTFGKGSLLVGGADGDLVIGDRLIEIKTKSELKVRSEDYHQLLGYVILSELGGIDGVAQSPRLRRVAIYHARYGYLYTLDLSEVIQGRKLQEMVAWVQSEADRLIAEAQSASMRLR